MKSFLFLIAISLLACSNAMDGSDTPIESAVKKAAQDKISPNGDIIIDSFKITGIDTVSEKEYLLCCVQNLEYTVNAMSIRIRSYNDGEAFYKKTLEEYPDNYAETSEELKRITRTRDSLVNALPICERWLDSCDALAKSGNTSDKYGYVVSATFAYAPTDTTRWRGENFYLVTKDMKATTYFKRVQ